MFGMTTGGTGRDFSAEDSRPLVLPLKDELSVSLSEEMKSGRETVSPEEVRRITLPMRAVHRGLGLELITGKKILFTTAVVTEKRGWERPDAT